VTVDEHEWLAKRFEENRTHLRAVAYRMLGSLSEADDAVQDAWLRLSRSDISDVENLGGWLATVVARLCLDLLRLRASRREESLGAHVPEPIANCEDGTDPEQETLLADSVGLAVLVVLDRLNPAERVAFVLHDMFAVPFDEIARIVGRSPTATRQLASRARRRVQGAAIARDADVAGQRDVIDVFLAAIRGDDFDALLALLDPDVVNPNRPRCRTSGRFAGSPRCAKVRQAGDELLGGCAVRRTSADQRGGGSRCGSKRKAIRGTHLHGQAREDHPNRRDRRPGASLQARSGGPR
jgi:RNA polymerase sigma factor (sigma-70 family)